MAGPLTLARTGRTGQRLLCRQNPGPLLPDPSRPATRRPPTWAGGICAKTFREIRMDRGKLNSSSKDPPVVVAVDAVETFWCSWNLLSGYLDCDADH